MKINPELHKMLSCPWAIAPRFLASMLETSPYATESDEIDRMLGLKEGDAGLDIEFDDEIAIVPISGVIGKKLPVWMQKFFGMVDVDNISETLTALEADESVKGILLDIDSPGGVVSGVPELAEQIAAMETPVTTYTDGLIASAAYWVASATQSITASKSSIVGSIGVFVPIMDISGMYEQAGIEVDVIKAGKFKAAGYPGTSLTDEQRKDLQSSVDYVYREFSGFVSKRRGVSSDTMQGQDFYAEQGVPLELVDDVGSRAQAMDDLMRLIATK